MTPLVAVLFAAGCGGGGGAPMSLAADTRTDSDPGDLGSVDSPGHDAGGDRDGQAEDGAAVANDVGVTLDSGGPRPLDSDGDGVADALDCAPNNKAVHPGATETCNTVDDDCDGKTDEDVTNNCGVCGALPAEVCNNKDDDCDGLTDEGMTNACGTCGAAPKETCNGKDDDCDGAIDEGLKNSCGKCGAVPAETCNGKDDDCDGTTDEGVKNKCGKCGPVPKEACNGKDDDCDGKVDEGVKNKCGKCGAVPKEICNGKDDDCDGAVDEGVKNKCGKCGAVPKEVCNGKDDDCDGAKDEGGVCGSGKPKVCYPGVNNTYTVCLNLVSKATIKIGGYNWPASSNPQYKQPSNLLDLGSASSSLKVAKNFNLGEFMQASKGKYGIYSAKTVSRWQSVRSALGVALHVNSGFRSPGYNAGIAGAAKFSRHMYGDAADVTAKGKVSLSKIASTCKAKGAGYTQLYSSHVHCDWRNDPLGHDFWPKKTGFGNWSLPPASDSEVPGSGDWQERHSWARVVGPDVLRPRLGRHLVFRAAWGPGFDEGIPWVQWHVHGPHRSWHFGPQVGLAFTPEVVGRWRVQWQVGARVKGEITFDVEPAKATR